ncbi:MAG: hypothetical protein JNL60_15875, partial [Bacteroidia bacterium]|nr:hypothetical protein [Bacteroidia bacterium]
MRTNYTTLLFTGFLLGFSLLHSSCKKKINDYPFEMEGVWYSPNGYTCGGPVLTIENNGHGRWMGHSGECDTRDPQTSGKVKYRKDILYVGDKSFTILEKPEALSQNDSIVAPFADDLSSKTLRKYLVLAKMTIQK